MELAVTILLLVATMALIVWCTAHAISCFVNKYYYWAWMHVCLVVYNLINLYYGFQMI